MELGHGGVRAHEPRAEQSEIGGCEREWRVTAPSSLASMRDKGTWQRWSAKVGFGASMVATPWGTRRSWRHFVDYVAGNNEAGGYAMLGSMQADFLIGSNSKVVHPSMLYIFYVGVIVIGDLN
jgi:hypothetical protein